MKPLHSILRQAPTAAAASRPAYFIMLALLTTGFLTVGGARDDLVSLFLWRPLSVLLLSLAISLCWRDAWTNGRGLLIFASAVVLLIILHLIPLPPAIWTSLPGRDIIAAIYRDGGMALPWQPLSVAQARTWNALFSLSAPLAMVIVVLTLDEHWQRRLLLAIIILGFFSGILGVMQAVGPPNGPLYFYRITNNGVSVGLFANRNHQAAFLATMYPLIAAYLSFFKGKPDQLFFQRAIALAGGLLLVPLILMTGSRAGLFLAVFGLLLAWWVYRPPVAEVRTANRLMDYRKRLITFSLAIVFLAVVVVVVVRSPALERLVATDPAGELRLRAIPILWDAVQRFFPFGSGHGTFVEVYQLYEPDRFITSSYFNHAHNDFIELAVTAGVPGLALLLWAGILGLYSLLSLIRNRSTARGERGFTAQVYGRAGFSIIAMLALYSAADYPLRVPSIMLLMAVAASWCLIAYRSARK